MSVNSLTILYEGSDLSGATANVVYLPILHDGTIKSLDVKTDLIVSGADAVFSVSKNGSVLGSLAPTIAVGSKIGTVGSLNIAVVKGDEIVLNLVSGAVSSPITFNLDVDDGAAGGTSLPAGDLNSATNVLERINGRILNIPLPPATIEDTFDGTNLNLGDWEFPAATPPYSVSGGAIHLEARSNGEICQLRSTHTVDFTNGIAIFTFANWVNPHALSFGIELPTQHQVYGANNGIAAQFRGDYNHIIGVNNGSFFFDSTNAAYASIQRIRIREDGGTIYFDYNLSASGGAWVNFTSTTASGAAITACRLFVELFGSGDDATVDILDVSTNILKSADSLTDKALLWWRTAANDLEPVSLSDLKAALNALP